MKLSNYAHWIEIIDGEYALFNSILMQIHDPAQTVPYYIESVRLSDKTYQGLPDNRY